MDLRPYINSQHRLDAGVSLIRRGLLGYQPFILSDDIEVGEGFNLCTKYADVESVHDLNAYAKGIDIGRNQPIDATRFRKHNAEYRRIYEYICDQIEANIGIRGHSFAEIGCNTGLTLFMLAKRGAAKCYGYDWNKMSPVFSWLNDVLETDVSFTHGTYDNLVHRFSAEVPEVDVMVNTVFMNHQCDPLQFLCFLCDRARKGVFLWTLTHKDAGDRCTISFPTAPPHALLDDGKPFPLYLYNDVSLNEAMLKLALSRLGFDDLKAIDRFEPAPDWAGFQAAFRMFFASRTRNVKSSYWRFAATQRRLTMQPLFQTRLWKHVLRPIKKVLLG